MWTVIVIIFILWLLGFFGGRSIPNFPKGNWIHILIVIAIILLILKLLNVV